VLLTPITYIRPTQELHTRRGEKIVIDAENIFDMRARAPLNDTPCC